MSREIQEVIDRVGADMATDPVPISFRRAMERFAERASFTPEEMEQLERDMREIARGDGR